MAQLPDAAPTGREKIEAGLALLRQAAKDAGQGLRLLASGLLMVTADMLRAVIKPQAWRRAFNLAAAGAERLLEMIADALDAVWRMTVTVAPIAVLMLALSVAAIGLAPLLFSPEADWREFGRQMLASLPEIAVIGLLLGAVAIGLLLVRNLIAWAMKRLTLAHAPAVLVGLLAIGAGAAIAAAISEISLFALAAWFAVMALVAGAAGFAVISFGPALTAFITLGGGNGGGRRTRKAKIIDVPHEAVGGGKKARPARSKAWPPRAWLRAVRPLLFVLALALLGALGAIWLRSPGGQSFVQARAERAAAKTAAAPEPAGDPASAVLLPLADGDSGEVYWRHGYRGAAMHMDGGAPVRDMMLPDTACEAAAIVVLGAASADGAADMNIRLAQRRALWAGAWAQRQAARCSSAPPVFAVSLGQAAGAPASPQQRRLRMLTLPPGGEAPTPNRVKQLAESAFADMAQFARFDMCEIAAAGAAAPALVDPCPAPPASPGRAGGGPWAGP